MNKTTKQNPRWIIWCKYSGVSFNDTHTQNNIEFNLWVQERSRDFKNQTGFYANTKQKAFDEFLLNWVKENKKAS